jgi:hypothetical protein
MRTVVYSSILAVAAFASISDAGTISRSWANLQADDVNREGPNADPLSNGVVQVRMFASTPDLGELPSDGANTFFVQPGISPGAPGTAAWDFVWSVDTSETNRLLSDFNIALRVGYQSADVGAVREEVTVSLSELLSSGALVGTSEGSGVGSEIRVVDNVGLARWSGLFGSAFNPSAAGTYDFLLSVGRSGDANTYSTSMSVVNVVPLPAAVWAGMAMLVAAGVGKLVRRP